MFTRLLLLIVLIIVIFIIGIFVGSIYFSTEGFANKMEQAKDIIDRTKDVKDFKYNNFKQRVPYADNVTYYNMKKLNKNDRTKIDKVASIL